MLNDFLDLEKMLLPTKLKKLDYILSWYPHHFVRVVWDRKNVGGEGKSKGKPQFLDKDPDRVGRKPHTK